MSFHRDFSLKLRIGLESIGWWGGSSTFVVSSSSTCNAARRFSAQFSTPRLFRCRIIVGTMCSPLFVSSLRPITRPPSIFLAFVLRPSCYTKHNFPAPLTLLFSLLRPSWRGDSWFSLRHLSADAPFLGLRVDIRTLQRLSPVPFSPSLPVRCKSFGAGTAHAPMFAC